MNSHYFRAAWSIVLLGLATGCSIYAPMLPIAPVLRDKNQAEVAAAVHINGRIQGNIAYSPIRHLLLTTAGSYQERGSTEDTTHFYNRQYEVGLGSYWPVAKSWLFSGQLGYGQAESQRGFKGIRNFLVSDPGYDKYKTHYNKFYGQVAASVDIKRVTLGLSYRRTWIDFKSLTYNGEPLPFRRMIRDEPMFLLRTGITRQTASFLKLQATLGCSFNSGNGLDNADDLLNRHRVHVREDMLTYSIGLIFHPHFLPKRAE
ncbi:hypothetical protein [Hymenobacter sp. DG25A]|uniref:hypothetical protein n=1 Tax=Hymenobacter sp. DG25A TaxID=1385663 RepID=UPI000B02CA83|nr:hypothetical protein [Hymenobacter sp. DG25A]